jgi:hypothetical protein
MALILCVGDNWDRREQVLKHRLVPALLLGVPATAALSASTAFVQAAEECRVKPSPAAPKGSRWLYRINRAEHRRCWFLNSRDVGLHSQVSRRHRHLGGDTDAVRQDEQRGSDLRVASAPTTKVTLWRWPSRQRSRKTPRLPYSRCRKIWFRAAFPSLLTGCHRVVRKQSQDQQVLSKGRCWRQQARAHPMAFFLSEQRQQGCYLLAELST